MKHRKILLRAVAALGIVMLGASCTTAYDAYGRPIQTVDPAVAIAGAAAAGLVGYAIADSNRGYYRGGGYHRGGGYYGGHGGHCY